MQRKKLPSHFYHLDGNHPIKKRELKEPSQLAETNKSQASFRKDLTHSTL